MKKLDEILELVAERKEYFDANGCFSCHYCGVDCTNGCVVSEVLYYLKTIETTENLYHDAVTELGKWKDDDWKDRYLPLTWEELKAMEGKPVWVELLYHHPEQKYKYWDVIKRFDAVEGYDLINLVQTGYLHKSLLNREWQAYRKEKK